LSPRITKGDYRSPFFFILRGLQGLQSGQYVTCVRQFDKLPYLS